MLSFNNLFSLLLPFPFSLFPTCTSNRIQNQLSNALLLWTLRFLPKPEMEIGKKKKNNIAFQWLYKAFNGDDGKNMVVGE